MKREKCFKLTDHELRFFHENGYIGPFTLYSSVEMAQIYKKVRVQLFNRQHAPYDTDPASSIANYDRHLDLSLLSNHICRPEIVDKVVSILGNSVLCWRSEFIPKEPGEEGTDWHQADTFEHASGEPQLVSANGESGEGAINVWTAFTDATEDNGCLMFIPRTHNRMNYDESKGMKYSPDKNINLVKNGVRRGFNGYDYRESQIDSDWQPDEQKAISLLMKAGEFIVFRSTLVHASKPNSTEDSMRLGYVARYVSGSTKVYPETDSIEEFGGTISLKNYGVVEVSGQNIEPSNRVRSENARGEPFKALSKR